MNRVVGSTEEQRLELLRGLGLLDTHPDACLDRVTRLASRLFDVPIAVVAFLDRDHVWHKACRGLGVRRVEHGDSLCAAAALEKATLVIPDAAEDARYAAHPFVAGAPHVRFYAGVPLRLDDGVVLGTFAVADTAPRSFSPDDRAALADLANIVVRDLERRRFDQNMQLFTEHLTDVVTRQTPEGEVFYVSAACRALLGWEPRDVLGASIADYIHADDREYCRRMLYAALRGDTQTIVCRVRHRDGRYLWVESTTRAVHDPETGTVREILSVTRDVSEHKQAEEALQESEARNRAILHAIPDLIFRIGRDGTYLDVEAKQEEQLARPAHELLGAAIPDVLPPEAAGAWMKAIDAALTRRTLQTLEYEIVTQDDRKRAFEGRIVPAARDEVQVIVRDITERRRREAQLAFQSNVLAEIQEAVIATQPDGTVTYFNRAAEQLFGVSCERIIGRRVHDAIVYDHVDGQNDAIVMDALRSAGTWLGETVVTRPDGARRHIESSVVLERDAEGRAASTIAIVRDITERRRAERALRESEDRYYRLFTHAPEPIVVHAEGRVVDFNQATLELVGMTDRDALLGEPIEKYIHPDDHALVRGRLGSLYATGVPNPMYEIRIVRVDGHVVETELVSTLITYRGEPAVLVAMRDVRERKEAARKLSESLTSFRELFDCITEAIYIQDGDGRFLDVNQGVLNMYGYTKDELLGQTPAMLSAPGRNDMERTLARVERAFQGEPQQFEWWGLRKNGEVFPKEVSLNRGEYFGQSVVIAVARDITDRYEAEQALRESEEKYRALVDMSFDAVFVETPQGDILECNASACEMLGYSEDEMRELTIADLVPDDFAAQLPDVITEDTGRAAIERVNKRKDGTLFPTEVHTKLVTLGGEPRLIAYVRDITERKEFEAELVKAKEHAEEMNRLKSAFLANMSHEIRTPLTSILGFAEILADEVPAESREFTNLIRRGGQRLMATLNSVLDLAQLESNTLTLNPEPVDLYEEAQDTLRLFYPQAQERDLRLRLEPVHAPVLALLDRSALSRVLSNLLSNAIKFTPSGTVTVHILLENDHVGLQVRDTGVGIDASFLPHLFDEFKQESIGLQRDYEGAGLGLTITRHLVELMKGSITVESEKGQGSTFTVTFPRWKNNGAVDVSDVRPGLSDRAR